ncbi:SDR family NAD(P)-dependent oxidoreductase [Micromonospora musae]|uniref:SDR family NAD(P)-dependent oxidoreductase n=1 Tax=Micromonospora musae TaxID=1894970 RepID=UPI0034387B50
MSLITTPFSARATAAEILTGVDLTGRRMIVTGGASGLGGETTRALAGAGAQVTIATRNPAAAKAIVEEFPGTTVAALDLADLASVRAFCDQWDGPLDTVVANAGVMALPERQLNAAGWEMQLATNYLGHFALVTGLRAALRSTGRTRSFGPRVVMVSSSAQLLAGFDFDDPHFERRPYDPLIAYAQSKAADTLFAVALSRRWAEDGICANAASPGSIHTNLTRHMDSATLQALGAMDANGDLLTPDYYKTPAQGAATTVLLAAAPMLEGVTGRYFEHNQEAEVVEGGPHTLANGPGAMAGVAGWSVDPAAADRLWEYTLAVTGAVA